MSTELVPVKYVGRKPSWADHLYGTGLGFVQGQVRSMPGEKARQFLRHADMFQVAGADELVPDEKADEATDDTAQILAETAAKRDDETEALSRILDIKQQVSMMDKDALKDFAFRNWSQKLDKRESIDELRAKVAQAIDQFGVA